MKKNILLVIIIITSIACKKSEVLKSEEKEVDKNLIFKKWLNDTLNVINSKNDINKSEITISKDSLYLTILKKHERELIKSNSINNDKEIAYGIDLLKKNNELPSKDFYLTLEIEYDYFVSNVENLKKDFDTNINVFIIESTSNKIEYNFLKGNLVDKRLIKP